MNSVIILLTIALGQANIPSITIQPTNEPIIVFQHAGELISVGKSTGKVTLLGNGPVTPDRPDNVNLTGLAKTVYDSMVAVVPPENRKPGAEAMIRAINATESQKGGLGLQGQQIIDAYIANCNAYEVNRYFRGWSYGDVLAGQNITDDASLMSALGETKKAMEAVK